MMSDEFKDGFLERHCPDLVKQIAQATAEGRAKAREQGTGNREQNPGSRNCVACGRTGRVEILPGMESVLHLCGECAGAMDGETLRVLQAACRSGILFGARYQYRQDNTVFEMMGQQLDQSTETMGQAREVQTMQEAELQERDRQIGSLLRACGKWFVIALAGWLLWLLWLLGLFF